MTGFPTKAKAPNKFLGDKLQYNRWKFTVRQFLKATMHPEEVDTGRAVTLISTYLDGNALNWFMSNERFLTTPTVFFEKYERHYDIKGQEEISYNQLEALCNQPWKGEVQEYIDIFEPLADWAENETNQKTLLRLFMYPLPAAVKDLLCHPSHEGPSTWKEAVATLNRWISNKNKFSRLPNAQLQQQMKSLQAGPVPMEIGAVQAPRSNPTTKPAAPAAPAPKSASARLTTAEFWKDKICNACGVRGHGRNWKSCPKHPEYKPKTYSAAVSTGDDHHSPVDPIVAVAATSAAATPAAANTPTALTMESLKMQLDNMQAMMSAMASNF
jgi:hypothetical protein